MNKGTKREAFCFELRNAQVSSHSTTLLSLALFLSRPIPQPTTNASHHHLVLLRLLLLIAMVSSRATSPLPPLALAALCLLLLALLAASPGPAAAGIPTPCVVNSKLSAKLNATKTFLQGGRRLRQAQGGEAIVGCLPGEA